MFQQILVLWDGSQLAEHALEVAGDLREVYDAELTAICVVERDKQHHHQFNEHSHGTPLTLDQHIERLYDELHHDGWVGGCRCELRVLHGDNVCAELLEHAHEHGFDLIVVGHHIESGPGHIFPQGLTDALVADSALPVMVVSG